MSDVTSLEQTRAALEGADTVAEPIRLGPITRRAADIAMRPISWLWPDHVPRGKLTVIAGDPGLGKSFLSVDLAARVSVGGAWPNGAPGGEPAGALLISAEDDPEDTTIPRLHAAGADLERVAVLDGVQDLDADGRPHVRPPALDTDVAAIEEAIREVPDCRLVVIDPVSAYVGKADSHNNAEVRAILAPVADMAERTGVALVAVTHLTKGQGKAVYRAMGSLAFVAAARTVWAVTADEEDDGRRLVVPVKNNVGQDRDGLAYRIQAPPEDADALAQPTLAWEEEPIRMTADEALAPSEEKSEREEAADWLREELADGPVEVKALQKLARDAGLGWETVKKARQKAGVESRKRSFSGGWEWVIRRGTPEEGSPRGPGTESVPLGGSDTSSA